MLPIQPAATQVPCAIREIFDRVGDKWSVVALARLHTGPRTFGVLRRSMDGVSRRMLSRTLRALERLGLISRTLRPTRPSSVEYELTPLGHGLVEPLTGVAQWADRHRDDITAARARYDARTRARSSADVAA